MRFESTTTELRSDTLTNWAMRPWVHVPLRANFEHLLQFHCWFSVTFAFGYFPSSLATFIWLKFSGTNHISVGDSGDTYGIHYWGILWSSYKKLACVGFEPNTTEFRSDALTKSVIRPCVQIALRANFVHLLQFRPFFSVTFHFGFLVSSVATCV